MAAAMVEISICAFLILAFPLAVANAGRRSPAKMAMIAMTTNSSIKVNPDGRWRREPERCARAVRDCFIRSERDERLRQEWKLQLVRAVKRGRQRWMMTADNADNV